MKLPIFQVDAFSREVFHGNPAAVCPLNEWLPDPLLQQIAAENNLSETAFFIRVSEGCYELRWFTPATEVDLCGHATLASAWVLFNELKESSEVLRFSTKSGELSVKREADRLVLDFPARPPSVVEVHPALLPALGGTPTEVLASRDYLVVYRSEEEVAALRPDMARLAEIDRFATIVTAPGNSLDFVSRFFAPAKGIPEDPVTGSAHCTLIPYWASRLGKQNLKAKQISARTGDLTCALKGDRVTIAGHAALYLKGSIEIQP